MRTACLACLVLLGCRVPPAGADIPSRTDDVRWQSLPHTDFDFQPRPPASLEAWQVRAQALRTQVRFAAGLIPEPARAPLNARIFGRLERPGYTVEKVFFESRPGLYVTGNLYRPAGPAGRHPAVACPHGHWPRGRLNHDERGSVPARCIALARLGAVVFSWDMIGYNDSGRQFDHRDEIFLEPALALWGIGPLAVQTVNSIAALDFLQSLPDVDPGRIGATGGSGGGTQTFILAAVDDRLQVAAPVNMISHTMQGGCICENAPLLRIDTQNMEIGALFAPRPLLLVSATGDWTKDTPQVEFPFIRGIYGLSGAADRVANVHIDAEHNYNRASREAMLRFFARHLLNRPDADSVTEGDIRVEADEDLLVFADMEPPADMPGLPALIERFKEEDRRRIADLVRAGPEGLGRLVSLARLGVSQAAGSEFPKTGDIRRNAPAADTAAVETRREELLTRDGRQVPLVRLCSSLSPVRNRVFILVHPDGLAFADAGREAIRPLLVRGRHVAVVEPFGLGGSRRPVPATRPQFYDKFFTTFNRTDAAEAVYDLLTVLAAELAAPGVERVSVAAFGSAGPVTLAALALLPEKLPDGRRVEALLDFGGFDDSSDGDYLARFFVPNVRRIGGLPAVAAAAAQCCDLRLVGTGGRTDLSCVSQAARLAGRHFEAAGESVSPHQLLERLAGG